MKSVNTISSTNVEDDSKENHHDTFTELQISDDNGSSNGDSRHMYRMGKEQQFNVSIAEFPSEDLKLTFVAHLQEIHDDHVHIHDPRHVGSRSFRCVIEV